MKYYTFTYYIIISNAFVASHDYFTVTKAFSNEATTKEIAEDYARIAKQYEEACKSSFPYVAIDKVATTGEIKEISQEEYYILFLLKSQ